MMEGEGLRFHGNTPYMSSNIHHSRTLFLMNWCKNSLHFAIMLLLFEIECQCTICKLAKMSPNEGIVALRNK